MSDDDKNTDTPTVPTIGIDGERIAYDGMVIGTVTRAEYHVEGTGLDRMEPVITLNLGWMKMAGVHVTVLDDPAVDHHRDGIAFDR
jgi:hypothetical protein